MMSYRSIRKATLDDLDTLISFQAKMAMETENLVLDREVLKKGISALLKDPTKGTYYVVTEHDEVVGCLLTTPEWSEWRNGTVLWIQSLFVKENFRNKGVFKAMYLYLKENVAREEGLKGIRLYVDRSNKAAQDVYEKIGMDGHHYQLYEWIK